MIMIDSGSPVPPYEQIRAAIAGRIAAGDLAAGAKLPPVRTLAAQLGLAPNTVARSYRDLEAAGLVETRGRAGTVVSARGDQAHERLVQAAQSYAALARELGVTTRTAHRIVEAALGSG